jgi:hypothetical protein
MRIDYSLKDDRGILYWGKDNIELSDIEKAQFLILVRQIIERSLMETNIRQEQMMKKEKTNGGKNG